jgi:gluconolactonase
MLNPFKQPELIKAETFMSMPAKFRGKGRTRWSDANRQGAEVDSFLEGPSFDRAGNLYFVDIPFGRVFGSRPGASGSW